MSPKNSFNYQKKKKKTKTKKSVPVNCEIILALYLLKAVDFFAFN